MYMPSRFLQKHTAALVCLLLASCLPTKADEGMWMVANLSARTDSVLAALGCQLTHDELFSNEHPALCNAVVQFGGFCSGVVVSSDGLVFTNHHCGFSSIQSNSSTEHDYLQDGFSAKTLADELPNEGLYVDFHLNTYDVTDLITAAFTPDMDGTARAAAADSVATRLQEIIELPARGIHAIVTPYYRGSQYYLSVYQRFSDVRLVYAPPQCLGKHGGDTDNWMWPRQTCDFSVFRIYADKDNQPAEYSADNVPYHPVRHAAVSTAGYQPGTFCMTLGYPGSTDRYLSSWGIENTMRATNDVRILVREQKLAILKDAMNSSDSLRIMYASKYASSSNYYKFSIGQNKALVDLGVVAEKQATEAEVDAWAHEQLAATGDSAHFLPYIQALEQLPSRYAERAPTFYASNLWVEALWAGSEVFRFAVSRLYGQQEMNDDGKPFSKEELDKRFKDIDIDTDQRLFAAMLKVYAEHVPDTAYLPDFLKPVAQAASYESYAADVFARSLYTQPARLAEIEHDSLLADDPLTLAALDAIAVAYALLGEGAGQQERLLGEALREMNRDKEYYPDANFTLRLSYGQVGGYNGYDCYTPLQSIIDKYEQQGDNPDYQLTEPAYQWLKKGKWGKQYEDPASSDLHLCFLTNNDITGGNSGSGMFDGQGRLIGLAFDGNWEAMSGDLKFDDNLQRCIGVDIRYVLACIASYGKGNPRLIEELTWE